MKNKQEIIFSEIGFKWNKLGKLAQNFYQDYQNITHYKILLNHLEKNKNSII
ncbi:ClbS/DfsB family four-helix bundle protein [Pelistega ratti]|uniref:ClbS/DfsB family four-helix bundle protein n=1 Tax=Pelistega ratti TaxID=2652177 RepID=UPI0039A566DC